MDENPAPVATTPARLGWAEASRDLAEAGDEPVWPEFANDDDEDLVW